MATFVKNIIIIIIHKFTLSKKTSKGIGSGRCLE